MSIPSNIVTEWDSLQAQVAAAQPLANASFPTIRALQLNAGNLVNDVQTALIAPTLLDTWTPGVDAPSIVSGFEAVVTASQDQGNLALRRGLAGRAASNLNQLV